MSTTAIARLESLLDDSDYVVRRERISDDESLEQLYVALLQDGKDRMYLMEMMFLSDFARMAEPEAEPDEEAEETDLNLLQFYCTFPFLIPPEAQAGVIRVLNFVNQSFPLGTFSVIPGTGNLIFRYVYPATDAMEVPVEVLLETISMAEMAISRLAPMAERVASAELSAQAALEDIAENGIFVVPANDES